MAGFLKRQFRKVIQWENADPNVIVWKFPLERKEEIMNKSQLVVREGQKAMFVQEGKLADTFSAGTYELDDIRNIPILTAMAKWKFAWESPYTGDVIFVSTKQFINNKWGTANPIMMRDPDFGVIRVRGFGTFSFAVSNPALALSELIGAVNELTVGNVNEYFKKIIASVLSNVIAESKYPALELAAHYDELADMAKIKLEQNFGEIGIEVKALFIENLSLPEEVEKTIDKRSSVGVMSGSMQDYAQYESVGAMRDAAKNTGGVAGMGIGLGAGVGIGQMFAQNFGNAQTANSHQNNAQNSNAEQQMSCPSCNAKIKVGAKFCSECGKPISTNKFCSKCGATVKSSAKFCPECGEKL